MPFFPLRSSDIILDIFKRYILQVKVFFVLFKFLNIALLFSKSLISSFKSCLSVGISLKMYNNSEISEILLFLVSLNFSVWKMHLLMGKSNSYSPFISGLILFSMLSSSSSKSNSSKGVIISNVFPIVRFD